MADQSYNFVPSHLAVQAMRDNGYKNAAYALAELMDNAIQAGATQVELLCGERKQQVKQRKSSRIEQVAVLDNGCGMNADVLRLALQFGNGTYLEEEKHTGIGRFGMGLPSSSVSQCQRVDVWSWQNGVENALYTYLDLEEIKSQKLTEVPEPQYKPIPSIWEKVGNSFGQSGTLVVWSQIDRCLWRTGKAIIENSELLIGRMYRKFLNNNQVLIRMVSFDLDNPNNISLETKALPNDPMYLMANTSCPEPFRNEPMFEPWEEEEGQYEIPFTVDFRGKKHQLKVRFSYAKETARPGDNPGNLPHGKHAAKNVGISVVRAGRELDLDQSLVNNYDPTERWWGIEVEFPPSLDDLFGVTNNKQSARNFSDIVAIDIKSLCQEGKSIVEVKQELMENEDPRGPLIDIAKKIQDNLRILRRLINKQTQGNRGSNKSNSRYQDFESENNATKRTKERQDKGYLGKSDQDESLPKEEREKEIEKTLIDSGSTSEQAKELAALTVNNGMKYLFQKDDLDTSAFFSRKSKAGTIVVTLNTKHPAYHKLVEVLEEDVSDLDVEKLRDRLFNAHKGLKLLLMAWARYEDEQIEGSQSEKEIVGVREDWGRIARLFLEDEED